ncbi:MAG: hypothetical protein WBC50_10255 [Dehalococcoidales bacterium]
MEDKERFDLMLLRFKQIDKRISSLEVILNTMLFKIFVNECMINNKIEPSKEDQAIAETEAAKAMGRMKAKIDAHVEEKDIPRYKKYLPAIN